MQESSSIPPPDIEAIATFGMEDDTASYARQTQAVAKGVLSVLQFIALTMLNIGTLLPDVLLHRNLGERHLTVLRCFVTLGLFFFLCSPIFFMAWFAINYHRDFLTLVWGVIGLLAVPLTAIVFIVRAIVDRVHTFTQGRLGIRGHSRSSGESRFYREDWFGWMGQYNFQRFAEPAAVTLLAIPAILIHPIFFNIVGLYGVTLFVRGALQHSVTMGKILDQHDHQLDVASFGEMARRWKQPGTPLASGNEILPFIVNAPGDGSRKPPVPVAPPEVPEWLKKSADTIDRMPKDSRLVINYKEIDQTEET